MRAREFPREGLKPEVLASIDDIDAPHWDALAAGGQPFLSHAFLSALERTRCVGADTGWHPRHLVLRDAGEQLVAAMPIYAKEHSWGEFVFDWSWAEAYRRCGLPYYPKLVAGVPFTPVTGTRMLTLPGSDRAGLARRLIEEARTLTAELGASSLHVLFPREEELGWLTEAGLELRKDCQFHWCNEGFGSFEDFLARFSSAKRKKVRRERRRVAEAGLELEWLHGGDIPPALWSEIYRFYASTFHQRGHAPYCTSAFFRDVARTLGDRLAVVIARLGSTPVAAALFFRDRQTLYGRYWGCAEEFHSLHFEACYYQGIDYCIAHGLTRFEPGTQGEHKLSRGFAPTATWSAHYIRHPGLAAPIARYLEQEREHLDAYIAEAARHLPFRAERE